MVSLRNRVFSLVDQFVGDDLHRVTTMILSGPAKGLKFDMQLAPSPELGFVLGRYESRVAFRLKQYCRKGMVVWECGSHIGYFTLMLAKLVSPSGQIVVFEPDDENRLRMERNLKLNRFANYQILPVAVGEDKQSISFYGGTGATSRAEGSYVGGDPKAAQSADAKLIQVPSVALDSIYSGGKYPSPDVLKMDIEGGELLALPHCEKLISEKRPIVFIESHNLQTDKIIWDTFTKHQYTLEHIPSGRLAKSASDVTQQMLAIPKNIADDLNKRKY